MPIHLNITADSPKDLIAQVSALALGIAGSMQQQQQGQPADLEAQDKPAGKSRGAAAKEKASAKSEGAGSATSGTAASGSTTTTNAQTAPESATQTSSADEGPIDRATVEPLCLQYSAKAGPVALKEVFMEMGSADGKWSQITDDKLGALKVRLEELLAA